MLFDGDLLILPLVIGFVLDSLFGDPQRLPHPIRLFGSIILVFEKALNKGNYRKFKGSCMASLLVFGTYALLLAIGSMVSDLYVPSLLFSSAVVFYGIANRSLITEVYCVEHSLSCQGIEAARTQLSRIVGRDTKKLSANSVRLAALETLSENLSDGVIAPLFYFAIGGPPLMLAYKMINTLDSMIGYTSPRYKDFGWFAARLDDWVNYIPARLTALLMCLVSLKFQSFRYVFKFGSQHSSPNSGYPEAALAGALGCRFGGLHEYNNRAVFKPYIGEQTRLINPVDFQKAIRINIYSTTLFIILLTSLNYLISFNATGPFLP